MRVGQRQRAGARPWRLSSEIGDHAIRVAVARHRRFALRPHVGQARPVRVAVQEIDIIVERGPAAPEPGPFDDVARHRIVEFRDSLGRECVVPRAQCDKRETERIGVGARGQGLQNRQQKEANRKQRTAHPDPPVRAVISQDIGRPRHRNSRTWQFRRRGVGSAPVFAKPRKTIQAMFKGSMPALVTPFAQGAVDFGALKSLVEWQIAEGSHGLVPVGTTGESPTLTHDEHEKVIEAVVATAAGRVPVIAGAGSNNTVEAIRFRGTRQGRGRRCRAGRHALLQQADAEGADRPFQRAERDRDPDHHLQHPAPVGDRHAARHDGRACQAAQHHRGQGCHRRPQPRAEAADHLRQGIRPAVGRGRHRRRLQRAGRGGVHLGHGQCRAKALRRDAGGDTCRRLCQGARLPGPADAAS